MDSARPWSPPRDLSFVSIVTAAATFLFPALLNWPGPAAPDTRSPSFSSGHSSLLLLLMMGFPHTTEVRGSSNLGDSSQTLGPES